MCVYSFVILYSLFVSLFYFLKDEAGLISCYLTRLQKVRIYFTIYICKVIYYNIYNGINVKQYIMMMPYCIENVVRKHLYIYRYKTK